MTDSPSSWQHERDYAIRGQRENSYVVTNGDVINSATSEPLDIWHPGLALSDLDPTPGTTLIGLYNNDNALPYGVAHYPATPLNRRIIIDEIGVKLVKDSTCNFLDYDLNVNVLWLNQMTFDLKDYEGSCNIYTVNNYQGILNPYLAMRVKWSPDRLYNGSVGPPEQTGYIPHGCGPNAWVIYADDDGDKTACSCVRPLVPLMIPETFRPPKDSFIIDPGQAIVVQLYSLIVPPPGYDDTGDPVSSVGAPLIAAWIRFRQPLTNDPAMVLRQRNDVF